MASNVLLLYVRQRGETLRRRVAFVYYPCLDTLMPAALRPAVLSAARSTLRTACADVAGAFVLATLDAHFAVAGRFDEIGIDVAGSIEATLVKCRDAKALVLSN